MVFARLRFVAAFTGALLAGACAAPLGAAPDAAGGGWSAIDFSDDPYGVSDAALATAVRGPDGQPLGVDAYDTVADAVRAGDMAAYIAKVRDDEDEGESAGALRTAVLSIDAAAGGDVDAARAILAEQEANAATDYIDVWMQALSGEFDEAVEAHRAVSGSLPGLTADLSLASLLEAVGRPEEALAVYASLTPGEITAPEHDFDPQGIVFGHIQTVIARRTLLLRRLGRVEDAKAVYTQLAESQPEEAVRYEAALASLEDGEGFDDAPLTPRSGFARTLADLSLSFYQQRLIIAASRGQRLTGFDVAKSTLDQLALLIDPENEDLRDVVIGGLYREALFDGAAHVALSAPEQTANLQITAARSLLIQGDREGAVEALERALALAEPDDRLDTLSRVAGQFILLDDDARAFALLDEARMIADNDAEEAFLDGQTAQAHQHFGDFDQAVAFARRAQARDDTHERRIYLATVLGAAGETDEALRILRTERLSRPNDPYMLNSLGYLLVTDTDRYVEAYKVLARSNALAPNDPYIADSFGWARYHLGDFEGALRYIEASRDEIAPHTHWEIDDHLGDIYWRLGREDEARAAWKQALTTYPPRPTRAAIEAKLEEGLTTPAPERQPLPDLSIEDRSAVEQRDI